MNEGLVRRVQVELARCSQNIEAGGDPEFWITRLQRATNEIEIARAVLVVKLHELRAKRRKVGG